MEWELTDDEIKAVWNNFQHIITLLVDHKLEKAIARAAQRKLMKVLEESIIPKIFGLSDEQRLFVFDSPEWQAVVKSLE